MAVKKTSRAKKIGKVVIGAAVIGALAYGAAKGIKRLKSKNLRLVKQKEQIQNLLKKLQKVNLRLYQPTSNKKEIC